MRREVSQAKRWPPSVDRRTFVALAAGAAAAPLVRAPAPEASPGALVDTHAYLGRWPFRRTPDNAPAAAAAEFARHGVAQAWVGTFEGVLHKDVSGANARLAAACRGGGGRLVPIGVVNPALPDWEEDVRRCHESLLMRGVRLHPNYHGYALDDPRVARLLELAAARRLVVQVVADLGEALPAVFGAPPGRADLRPLAAVAARFADVRVTVHGGGEALDEPLLAGLAATKHVYVDAGGVTTAEQWAAMAKTLPAERWVLGSRWPLQGMESLAAATKLPLSAEDAAQVGGGAARGVLKWATDG